MISQIRSWCHKFSFSDTCIAKSSGKFMKYKIDLMIISTKHLWRHKIILYQKLLFVISQNEIKSNLWYQKVDFVSHKIEFVILQNYYDFRYQMSIFMISRNWYCDITNLCLLFCISTDQDNFMILQMNILFAISHNKLKFCDITISILK